ncbi:uncharacterized protein LOC108910070 [Anoplophora glabripennis]|uniref:uncharacterized protein LOC108910070 n=1 Tax=Anoplophora glabripennis TaxID=217634 RepID=UPI000874A406|nr:uncharacterized protein LOC108910070 [Anoplophora glabripennis]
MEVMEDGNLMDKVHILIQRDMEYYKDKQAVLQETICPGVIGGRLDFPRSASFAAMKLVLWWEEEYVAAYKNPSGFLQKGSDASKDNQAAETEDGGKIVKDSDPSKFANLISKSADQLLEHLHVLTQEALDHADLSVLTGTIGAAALLKNCLWFFIQSMSETKNSSTEELQAGYKKYNEMCEALAERLLDLHCRLLSLYILQDAECLDWEGDKPFFESERGSYTIQMWWLYMQGTKEDLWNTVPPKMAQRVFSGMLNESLTILTIRYTQSSPSEARSQLLVVDISNLLLCVAQLLPSICDTAKDFIGLSYHSSGSKILRDIHTKCQELLTCLPLRGSSLNDLHKVFKKGIDNVEMFKPKTVGPVPWIIFGLPNIFKDSSKNVSKMTDLPSDLSIALELMVLLAQPQPNWALLLKVLCMKKCKILQLILYLTVDNYTAEMQKKIARNSACGSFLCSEDGTCRNVNTSSSTLNEVHYYDLISSSTEVLLYMGNDDDLSDILLPIITKNHNWAKCFERRNVWNQIRPPWYEAILHLISPLIPTITESIINAVQTGATMYQSMSLTLALLSFYWDCANPILTQISALLQEIIPADIVPMNNSALLQILVSALYSAFLHISEGPKKEVKFAVTETNPSDNRRSFSTSFDAANSTTEAIALAVAESLCSIDEDNKHTDQIEEFLEQVKNCKPDLDFCAGGSSRVETTQQMLEVLVSDLLITTSGKKSLKTLYHFMKHNSEWLYQKLGVSEDKDDATPNKVISQPTRLLHTMFHIGYRPFDQLLTGELQPNWFNLLQTPMGLTSERVWMQLSPRWEFRNINSSSLSSHDVHIINNITSLLKQ